MKLYGLDEESILKQIQDEYQVGFDAVEDVRETRRQDLKEFFDPDADETKIHIRTIMQAYRMQIAISTKSRPEIEWTRRRIGDTERAKNVNQVLKYDWEEMNMDQVEYMTESNMRKVGVGIQVAGPFDTISKNPTIEVVDTLSWIPDPKGGPTMESHRWAGFEVKMQMWQMKKLKYENLEYVSDNSYTDNTQNAYQDATGINTVLSDSTPNKEWDVYIHFLIREGKKYKAICNGNRTKIHKLFYLNPVTDEEKLNESKVPFPISLRYAFYDYGRPYGISTVDLLRDTQSALTRLFNLYLAQVFRAVFGGDRLVRFGELEDPDTLNTPTIEGKDIPVKSSTTSLNDIMAEVPREQTNNLPPNMIEMLKRNAQENIGASSIQQGVVDEKSNTLGEQEMAQRNANIQFELEEKVMLWGHAYTWKYLWYRQYIANMKEAEQKEGAINSGVTRVFFAFKKDDFVGSTLLSLSLKGSSQVSQEKSNKAEKGMILQGLIASSQSEGEKRKYYRMWSELADFSDEQIDELISKTGDEIGAEIKLAMINEGMDEGAVIDSMDDDHQVYINYITTADDGTKSGPIKEKALKARYDAIRILQTQTGLQDQQTGVEQSGASASQAQLASGVMNQSKKLPSNATQGN